MLKVKPKVIIFNPPTEDELIERIIVPLRNCYRSFDVSTEDGDRRLISHAIKMGHTSILEQAGFQFAEIMNRGVHNENVRQRTGFSRAAESTRWANYEKDKHGKQITVIDTVFFKNDPEAYLIWEQAMKHAETAYMLLVEKGYPPQAAREVLPLSLKITDVQSANITGLRYRFSQRITSNVHPEFRRITLPSLKWYATNYPLFFKDMYDDAELCYEAYEREYGSDSYAEIIEYKGKVDINSLLSVI